MPRYTSWIEYKRLKDTISQARLLRYGQVMSYEQIANVLNVSKPMAIKYVKEGDEMLKRNKPEEIEKEHWAEIVEQLLKLYDTGISEDKFGFVVAMWLREVNDPVFREYLAECFKEKEIDAHACQNENTYN